MPHLNLRCSMLDRISPCKRQPLRVPPIQPTAELKRSPQLLAARIADLVLPQVSGFAALATTTGDPQALQAVQHFFEVLTTKHSFATGGSGDYEWWGPPDTMADALQVSMGLLLLRMLLPLSTASLALDGALS